VYFHVHACAASVSKEISHARIVWGSQEYAKEGFSEPPEGIFGRFFNAMDFGSAPVAREDVCGVCTCPQAARVAIALARTRRIGEIGERTRFEPLRRHPGPIL
jgi:hypothetical protein